MISVIAYCAERIETLKMRIIQPFRSPSVRCSFNKIALVAILYLATLQSCLALRAAEEDAPRPDSTSPDTQRPTIVIRPANFDPADEFAYTRRRGEVEPGKLAEGRIWNKSAEDLRAAVSGEISTPPAPAENVEPVSAASGQPVPRMTYAQAYAHIPFSRSEYEANPGYRHDAALELMFGVLRPVTVMRQTTPYFSRYPDLFRYRYSVYPYASGGGGASNMNMNMYWNTSLIAY
jgi:hypothetical protein